MINLAKATEALASRGYDNQGIYHDEVVGLGHRRLSIIDVSEAGFQPLWDNSGRYCIIYNGEVYNFQELRKQLLSSGINFRSETDTEVVLNLFIKEGPECLTKLNGFFAFAIYDKEKKTLFLARDRFGIKPLYYYHDQDKFLFASEMKSILKYGLERRLDYEALVMYLQLNYIPAPHTALAGVGKINPGNYVILNGNDVGFHQYYNLDHYTEPDTTSDYESSKKTLRKLLSQSVRSRLVADVPLGSFLSGGVDSSIIAALAKQENPDLHTFSIGYSDEKFFDESDYARAVAKHIGTEHSVFDFSNKQMLDNVENVLNYLDEPFADSSALAVFMLSQETRKHSTVALSGDGADEMFAGYNKHKAFFMATSGKGSLLKNFSPLLKVFPKSRHGSFANKLRQTERYLKGLKLNPVERYWYWATFANQKQALQLLSGTSRDQFQQDIYDQSRGDLLRYLRKGESINEVLLTDMKLVLPDDMLTKVDRMSMANNLEIRVPFLDHNVVQFVTSLPSEYKINRDMRKRILQDTFADMLPPEIYNRPKQGFEVPLIKWLRKDLKSMVQDDVLADSFVKDQGVFNVDETKKLKRKLFSSNPGDSHARVWALVVFQWWWRKYFA